jgi:hypothetical protein
LSGAFIADCLSHAKEEEDDDKIIDL